MSEEVSNQEVEQPVTPEGEAPATEQPESKEGETQVAFEERMDALLKENPRTLKVNGKDRVIKSWAEWERYGSREMAAEERFAEAKKLREEAESIKQLVESGDLLEILKRKGLEGNELKKALGDVVNRLIEEEEMDPRDRKLKEYEAKEAARKAAEEETSKKEQETAHSREVEAKAKEYVEQITDSAERLGLKGTPWLLAQVAHELQAAHNEGAPVSVDVAVRMVRDNFVGDYSSYIREMPFEVLKEVLGEDTIKKIQREAVSAAKGGSSSSRPVDARKDSTQDDDYDFDPTESEYGRAARSSSGKISQSEFFKKLNLGQF